MSNNYGNNLKLSSGLLLLVVLWDVSEVAGHFDSSWLSITSESQQVARSSWWDRSAKRITQAETHRVRSDLPPLVTRTTAEGIDRLWLSIDDGLGKLRPRSRGLQQALFFSTHEDLAETMRSQFAVDAPSGAFAFFSPLGQGIAVCAEDTPRPVAARGLSAAVGGEYLRLSCGADLAPVLHAGVLDYLARLDANGTGGGIGEAGAAVVRKSVASATALSMFELMSMTTQEWNDAIAKDSSGALREQAASVVRFLTRSSGSTAMGYFQNFLRQVAEGTQSFEAFSAVYGLRDDRGWEAFDKQWRSFAKSEKSSSVETLRERLAYFGEGMRMLDGQGGRPADFEALVVALQDRKFASPIAWGPGFSKVDSTNSSVFTPIDPYEQATKNPPKRSKSCRFEFEAPPKELPDRPASIVTVDCPVDRVKLTWVKTRPEPEALWVWEIER